MKRVYRNLIFFSLSGLLCLFLAVPASAQHRGGGGGGGHFSGGGGHGGGGGHYSGGGGARYSGGGAHYSGGGAHYSGNARSYSGGHAAYAGHGYAGRGAVVAHGGAYSHYGYRGGYHGAYGYRGGAYRGYGYGGRFGYGGFYYHSGFYGSIYGPRIGFSVGFLPFGYYPFWFGDYQYYYSNGFYYQYNNNQYTVVEPPVGAQISTLPSNAQSIVINGQQYYEVDGVYYVAITKDDGSLAYQVAGKDGELNTDDQGGIDQGGGNQQPPADNYDQGSSQAPMNGNGSNNRANVQVGDIVPSLPTDSRGVTVNGTRMFVTPDDVYYQETRDNNGHKAYKVVGLPSDSPQ